MKQNNVFLAVIVTLLVAIIVVLAWHDLYHGQTEVKVLTTEKSIVSQNLNPNKAASVVKAKAPVAPKSEVDQKLEKLGFGSSAEVHKITVGK